MFCNVTCCNYAAQKIETFVEFWSNIFISLTFHLVFITRFAMKLYFQFIYFSPLTFTFSPSLLITRFANCIFISLTFHQVCKLFLQPGRGRFCLRLWLNQVSPPYSRPLSGMGMYSMVIHFCTKIFWNILLFFLCYFQLS